jgi:hypothetical protein
MREIQVSKWRKRYIKAHFNLVLTEVDSVVEGIVHVPDEARELTHEKPSKAIRIKSLMTRK